MTDIELKYYKALQGVFKEKMGAWKYRDNCWCSKCGVTMYHNLCSTRYGRELLRLPLPIDPRNPERGCWFMLTKENRTDKVFLNELAASDNPTLVILKKLANQEGVTA